MEIIEGLAHLIVAVITAISDMIYLGRRRKSDNRSRHRN